MSRWFRFYDDVINDPKVLCLPDALRWQWVAILCIASKSGGDLPTIEHLSLMLRTSKHKAAATLTALFGAGLLDKTETGFRPHNWDARQYKSDVSTERVKRFRKQQRNVSETPPETEADTEQKSDDGGERATDAFELASDLAAICGHATPQDWPPGWCGSPHWVQKCLNEGWLPDVMRAETQAVTKRKRDGPIDSFFYLEKPLARAHARHSAPLPKVEITQETIHATTRENSLKGALRRFGDDNEARRANDRALEGGGTPPRLLSHG